MTKEEVLQACTVDRHIVKLPGVQLDRNLYLEVKKSLELIGGKWTGGKTQGFVFQQDPAALLKQVGNGQRRDLKKEFQFFATPDSLADEMVRDANIQEYDMVLEPSAGQGAIIKAIHRRHPGHLVHYCELMDINRSFLCKLKDVSYITDNFLKLGRTKTTPLMFDKIIANPPFSKNHDIDHIRLMYRWLNPGGRIVTIASKHWLYSSNKKEKEFNNWIYNEVEADVNTIEAGAFAESGTKIETVLIEINK